MLEAVDDSSVFVPESEVEFDFESEAEGKGKGEFISKYDSATGTDNRLLIELS